VRVEVHNKAKQEVQNIRRKLLLAVEAAKPKKAVQKGALVQAAFLAAADAARGSAAQQAANASKMSLLTAPDPYDETLFGVTNLALYQAGASTPPCLTSICDVFPLQPPNVFHQKCVR